MIHVCALKKEFREIGKGEASEKKFKRSPPKSGHDTKTGSRVHCYKLNWI